MSIFEYNENEKIHSRDISIATYPSGDDAIIVEGVLMEKRLQDYYIFTGEKKNAGVLHHMIIRMRIEGSEKRITDIDVDMPGVPREGCAELKNCLNPLTGCTLTQGFTQKVLSTAGGINGCFHLVSLLLAMAPAAMQGHYAHRARRPFDMSKLNPETVLKTIPLNSCGMWREDGPLVCDIINKLKELYGDVKATREKD